MYNTYKRLINYIFTCSYTFHIVYYQMCAYKLRLVIFY